MGRLCFFTPPVADAEKAFHIAPLLCCQNNLRRSFTGIWCGVSACVLGGCKSLVERAKTRGELDFFVRTNRNHPVWFTCIFFCLALFYVVVVKTCPSPLGGHRGGVIALTDGQYLPCVVVGNTDIVSLEGQRTKVTGSLEASASTYWTEGRGCTRRVG